MKSNKKKFNCGSDFLIPRDEWGTEADIQGGDEHLLKSPIMNRAFNKILEIWKPRHKMALVSLCTSTRPYSKSRKWKTFKELFGDDCDLIICSLAGIIPIEFENCYPYLSYDGFYGKQYDNDKLYVQYAYRRLMTFFKKHHYDVIILNFRPNINGRIASIKFKQDFKGNSKIYILPNKLTYEVIQKDGFPGGKMFPDLDERVLREIKRAILHNKK